MTGRLPANPAFGPCARRASVGVLCAGLWLGAGSGLAASDAEPAAPPLIPRTESCLRSETGRFLLVGTNDVQTMALSRWAETIGARMERLLGFAPSPTPESVRIVVRPPVPDQPGVVTVKGHVSSRGLVQTLTLYGHEEVDAEEMVEALSRIWLNACVYERIPPEKPRPPAESNALPVLNVPFWMVRGLAQNVFAGQRERNHREALSLWSQGAMPTPAGILAVIRIEEAERIPFSPSVCGLFFQWLAARPDAGAFFHRACVRLASGHELTPSWLAACWPDCDSPAELADLWDAWLLNLRRVVHRPGRVTPDAVAQLKAQLLLYPGSFGMPLTDESGRPLALSALIDLRDEAWIPSTARNLSSRLRLLTVGRGPELAAVVDQYDRFLDALAGRRRPAELRRLLSAAEAALAALESQAGHRDTAGDAENDRMEAGSGPDM